MCFAVNKGSRKLFLNGFAGGTSVFICGLPSPSPPLFEVVRNQRAGVHLLPPPAWIPFGGGEAGAWGEPHHGLASCLPGSACRDVSLQNPALWPDDCCLSGCLRGLLCPLASSWASGMEAVRSGNLLPQLPPCKVTTGWPCPSAHGYPPPGSPSLHCSSLRGSPHLPALISFPKSCLSTFANKLFIKLPSCRLG